MHVDQGGADHTGGEGGCREEGGGDEEGGGAEEREESSVDGVVGWARMGKERQLPQNAVDCAHLEDLDLISHKSLISFSPNCNDISVNQ